MNDRMRVVDYFNSVYAQHDRFWWREPGRYALDPNAYPFSLLTQKNPAIRWPSVPGAGHSIEAPVRVPT